MEAEREMVKVKQCVFMQRHVGAVFEGTVTGVAPHGLYVTLDEVFVDGLVHVSQLPRMSHYDERAHAFVVRLTRERYRLGDRMPVRLRAVDPILARIDFSLVTEPGPPRRSSSGRQRRR